MAIKYTCMCFAVRQNGPLSITRYWCSQLKSCTSPSTCNTWGAQLIQVSSRRGHKCNWMGQSICGPASIAVLPFVRATLLGLQRHLAKPKVRKDLITTEMLAKLVDNLDSTPKIIRSSFSSNCSPNFLRFCVTISGIATPGPARATTVLGLGN